MQIENKVIIPDINSIDYKGLPDREIVKQTVDELIKWFIQIPEEERLSELTYRKENKEEFVAIVRNAMIQDIALLAQKTVKDQCLPDVDWTAEQVVDFVFSILKESNPTPIVEIETPKEEKSFIKKLLFWVN